LLCDCSVPRYVILLGKTEYENYCLLCCMH